MASGVDDGSVRQAASSISPASDLNAEAACRPGKALCEFTAMWRRKGSKPPLPIPQWGTMRR